MALYRRSLSIRATLMARTLNPSFTYISHCNNEHTNHDQELNSSGSKTARSYLTHRRSFGSYLNNAYSRQLTQTLYKSRTGSDLVRNGPVLNRLMSTSIMIDAPMNPATSEVAAAAADMAVNPSVLHFIDAVGSFTGLNWWASIALATLLIRVPLIPFLIMDADYDSKYELMRGRLEEIDKQMEEKEGLEPLGQVLVEKYTKKMEVYKEYNVNPLSSIGLIMEGPLYISFMLTIPEMAEKIPSLKTGGALWFTDLTTPDPTFILPVFTTLVFWKAVEVIHMKEGSENFPKIEHKAAVLALLALQWSIYPQAVYFYLIPSAASKLCFELVLQDPHGRKALGLSEMPAKAPSRISANSSKNSK